MSSAVISRVILGFLLMLPVLVGAQRIDVGETVTISADAPHDPHGESFFAINPKNPKNMIATSCVVRSSGSGSVGYVTHDGGKTWKRATLPMSADSVLTSWDAIAYFDENGIAYYGANNHDNGLWITRSFDEGRTWTPVTLFTGSFGLDRQFMGFDRTGKFRGRVYVGASVHATVMNGKSRSLMTLATSRDSGRTFGPPRLIEGLENEGVFGFANIVVTPDGTLVLPIITNPTGPRRETEPKTGAQWGFRTAVSGDGGETFAMSERHFTYYTPVESPRSGRTQSLGNTAIDVSSGPYRGRIYFAWTSDVDGANIVQIVHSSDNGKTWSKPTRVNDNTNKADHANATVAVNNRGVVGVSWNDRRKHTNDCYDLYFAASLDGGATFLPNVTTGRKPTCPNSKGNWTVGAIKISGAPRVDSTGSIEDQWLPLMSIATRFESGGDTQGLAADVNGVFHAGWIDGSSGVMQLATTPFAVHGTVVGATSAVARPQTSVEARSGGGRDVSTQVKLVSKDCKLDWSSNRFSCTMYLENQSTLPVTGPFEVRMTTLHINFRDFQTENADNGKSGVGAHWIFPAPNGNTLPPGGRTAARVFRWRFSGLPDQIEYPFMIFNILAAEKTTD
jgi:hypothetical protein